MPESHSATPRTYSQLTFDGDDLVLGARTKLASVGRASAAPIDEACLEAMLAVAYRSPHHEIVAGSRAARHREDARGRDGGSADASGVDGAGKAGQAGRGGLETFGVRRSDWVGRRPPDDPAHTRT